MSSNIQKEYLIGPIERKNKNFIFKGKKYPISFDTIKNNSNYFYENSENYKNEDIELQEEIDITENTIESFINCCQNKKFKIDDSIVFQLDYLSKKYEVPELIKITQEYIRNPNTNLAFESLIFKNQLQKSKKSENELHFIDTSNEEEIIGSRLKEYLNDQRLLDFPIPVIDRILKNYLNKSNDQNDLNQIVEFLFKCLDKHDRKASILFLNIVKIENQPKDLIIRLINNYWNVFDFNMVNLDSLLNTSSELLKELIKMKREYEQKLSEMNQIILEQKEEIAKFNEARNLIDNDFKNLIQKQNQTIQEQKDEIAKINQEQKKEINKIIQNQKDEIEKINKKQKEEINKIIQDRSSIDSDVKSLIQKQNQVIQDQKNEIDRINKEKNSINNELKSFIERQNRINEENKRSIESLKSSNQQIQNDINNQASIFITRQIQTNNFYRISNNHFLCNFFLYNL